jgi:hypothetical protein
MGDGHAVIAGGLGCGLGGCRLDGFGLVAIARTIEHCIEHSIPSTTATQPINAARAVVREKVMQMISGHHNNAVIDEYIRTKGVTRCPTACAVPTQGSVDKADRAALEEYAVTRARQRRERAAARARLFWSIDLPLPPSAE